MYHKSVGYIILIEQELLAETLVKLYVCFFRFVLIREKMTQVQTVVLLKYCRCSFSRGIIQSGLISLIFHPASYLKVVKYPFRVHAKTRHRAA